MSGAPIVITGAAGFIGRAAVEAATGLDLPVRAIVRRDCGLWRDTPGANRVGDFGVLIGMFACVSFAGSFEFSDINAYASVMGSQDLQFPGVSSGLTFGNAATFATLFLFLGCTGKSAQVPLYVWLPDAMAGPTPVSALIHAATMVTSGIYLCCRLSPLFLQSEVTMSVIAVVGALTAFLGATIAITQHEMKKILAYSTVSQLGFMFAGVGVGAFAAGFFHVFTHAFFKACLFLGAGSVMHAVHAHGDADIFKLGGMKRFQPWTRWTFLFSCFAIAGFPPTSGFFSKDELLVGAANVWLEETALPSSVGAFVFVVLAVSAFLTAFYMFRLYFLTFEGSYRSAPAEGEDPERGGHAPHDDHGYAAHPHESERSMTLPLVVLAFGALVVGFLGMPHWLGLPNWWEHWMEASITNLAVPESESHTPHILAMAVGTAVALGGIGAAWLLYYKGAGVKALDEPKNNKLTHFLFDKWRVDEFYGGWVLGPIKWIAIQCGRVDRTFVDTLLTRATSGSAALLGHLFTRLQVGVVHAYGLAIVVGTGVLGWWFLYPHARVDVTPGAEAVALSAGPGLGYEYRWDLDADGAFDVPLQPETLTVVLSAELEQSAIDQIARRLSNVITSVDAWPDDRRALGTPVGLRRYTLTPPAEALARTRQFIESTEGITLEGSAPAGERFGDATAAEHRYDEDDHVGFTLAWQDELRRSHRMELAPGETLLDASLLAFAWEPVRPAEAEPDPLAGLEPAFMLAEDGSLSVRPNGADHRGLRLDEEGRASLAAGDRFTLGGRPMRIVPRVRARVQVRNAFGNVATETVEFDLDPDEAPAAAPLAQNDRAGAGR
ncbi:MAG: NADH-quinone oxidoreductase subunit L [Myxococcota bacterium]